MEGDFDRPIVLQGSSRTIECAICLNGSMPAKEFIENLEDDELRRLVRLLRVMAETGKIFNREQFKQVEGKIYEFKRHQVRVGCFQIKDRWLLTHGFIKKSARWPKAELERAQRIMNEHLKREAST